MLKKNIAKRKTQNDCIESRLNLIEKDMASVKTDVNWLKEGLTRVEGRQWYVIAGIAVTIGLTILTIVIK